MKSNNTKQIIDTENQMLEIWQRILDTSEIDKTDSLFDFGGSSVLVKDVISSINKTFGSDLTVAQFFQYPTIETLSAFLVNIENDKDSENEPHRISQRQQAMTGRKRPKF